MHHLDLLDIAALIKRHRSL